MTCQFDDAKLDTSVLEHSESLDSPTPTNSQSILSVNAEDSGIISFPLLTLNAMWKKASELLSCDNGITPAPGTDPKARMVISYSQQAPHHVRSSSRDHDSNCPQ